MKRARGLDIKEAIRMFSEGAFLEDRQAARHFGVHEARIHRFHKKYGFWLGEKDKTRIFNKIYGPYAYQRFCQMRNEGKTFEEISIAFLGKPMRQWAHQWWSRWKKHRSEP